MKNLKTLLTISFITGLLCFGTVKAQSDGGQQFVTIKTFERLIGQPEMYVLDNNGETTFKNLDKINLNNFQETFSANSKILKVEIDRWLAKGYVIHTYETYIAEGNTFFSTIILIKD